MPSKPSKQWRAWIRAARPLAQGNIAPPLVLGQALAWSTCGRFSWAMAAFSFAFGVLDHLFIVFANDYADQDADAQNEGATPFSGGSRVIALGQLEARDVGRAALVAAFALVALGSVVALACGRPWLIPLALAALGLLWAYSYPPLRLSYRGGGELLQGLGVGVVLPLVGFYAQAADLGIFPWEATLPTFLMAVAGNVTTAIPDEPWDRRVDKRSWPVVVGAKVAAIHGAMLIAGAAALVTAVTPEIPFRARLAIVFPAQLFLLPNLLTKLEPRARARLRYVVCNGLAITWVLVVWSMALFRS